MLPYRIFLRYEVSEVLRKIRGPQRSAIIGFIDTLKSEPDSLADYTETDERGREVKVRVIGSYAITYWADHAVMEV